jgi:hypothetical protein
MDESPVERPCDGDIAPGAAKAALVEGIHFYREGPYVVFTEAAHLQRGHCCGSGCRHCPWRDNS